LLVPIRASLARTPRPPDEAPDCPPDGPVGGELTGSEGTSGAVVTGCVLTGSSAIDPV
jgi:hypothetical protein